MEQIKIDLIPKFVPPVCHASQYDKGRVIRCYITDDGEDYTILSNDIISIYIRKLDGFLVTADCGYSVGNNYVDFTTTEQMTAVVGDNIAEIKIVNGDRTVGTLNFIFRVELDPTDNAITSDSEIGNLQTLVDIAVGNEGLEDLGGVDISEPSDGDILVYNSETGKWENSEGESSNLSDLGDVNISSPTDGQILKYDATSHKWINASGGGGGSGGHVILDDGGTSLTQRSNLQFKGAYSEDNSTDSTTKVNVIRSMTKAQFDLLSADEKIGLINVTDVTGNPDNEFQPVIRSTTEREIGVWTDGKPLYEKTINFGALPNNTYKEVAHNISNIEICAEVVGVAYNSSTYTTLPMPYISGSNVQYYIDLNVNDTNIKINTFSDRSAFTGYVTLHYTKTTDQAGSGQWTPQGVPAVHYSTTEQVVGTWTDGSTLYEKTCIFTGQFYGNVTVGNISISNLNEIVSIDGSTIADDGAFKNLTFAHSNATNNMGFFIRTNGDVEMRSGSSYTASSYIAKIIITIRYTKSSS